MPPTWSNAKALAASDLLPAAFRGKPANIAVAVGYGRALGLEPMIALAGITVIDGKPSLSAQLQSALVRRAGNRHSSLGMLTPAEYETINRAIHVA